MRAHVKRARPSGAKFNLRTSPIARARWRHGRQVIAGGAAASVGRIPPVCVSMAASEARRNKARRDDDRLTCGSCKVAKVCQQRRRASIMSSRLAERPRPGKGPASVALIRLGTRRWRSSVGFVCSSEAAVLWIVCSG